MRKNHQPQRPEKVYLMENIIAVGEELHKYFFESGLNFLPSVPQRRIQEMILAMAQKGYSGKMADCGELRTGHRTTYRHFLSKGKWNHEKVEKIQRHKSFQTILSVAEKANQPVYLSIDDTVVPKKTPPSCSASYGGNRVALFPPGRQKGIWLSNTCCHCQHRQQYIMLQFAPLLPRAWNESGYDRGSD